MREAQLQHLVDTRTHRPEAIAWAARPRRTRAVMASWRKTLQMPTVRGLVIGRPLLFPPDDNVAAAVDAVVEML